MKPKNQILLFFILWTLLAFPVSSLSQEIERIYPIPKLTLVRAVMCEDVQAFTPVNTTVSFSATGERAACFTTFDPVPEQTYVYHRWYHRGIPSADMRLTLKPPRWSTFSHIKLRDTDRGPWRVEIIDADDKILQTLQFSILD